MESDSPRRRRRRRKRRSHQSGSTPKPLSIDLLKKKRHKNARRVRIASARLDLDESTTYESSTDLRKVLSKTLAGVVAIAGIILILNDIGWGVLRDGLTHFVTGVGKGARESISGGRDQQAAALSEMAARQSRVEKSASGIFRPEGDSQALEKMSLAMEARRVGLTTQAITLLDEAREIDPEVVGVSLLKGQVYKEKGDLENAIIQFKEALEKPREQLFAAQELGDIYYAEGDFGKAVEYLSQAQQWKPDEPSTAHELSRALRMAGRPMEGLFAAREAFSLLPEQKVYEISARLAAIQAGEYDPPPPEPAPLPKLIYGAAPPKEKIRSPFELVVEAGIAAAAGRTDEMETLWQEISIHTDTLPPLKELKEDPLFRLAGQNLPDPEVPSP